MQDSPARAAPNWAKPILQQHRELSARSGGQEAQGGHSLQVLQAGEEGREGLGGPVGVTALQQGGPILCGLDEQEGVAG